jgi:hypothetical protein
MVIVFAPMANGTLGMRHLPFKLVSPNLLELQKVKIIPSARDAERFAKQIFCKIIGELRRYRL